MFYFIPGNGEEVKSMIKKLKNNNINNNSTEIDRVSDWLLKIMSYYLADYNCPDLINMSVSTSYFLKDLKNAIVIPV